LNTAPKRVSALRETQRHR